MHRDSAKNATAFKPADFLPEHLKADGEAVEVVEMTAEDYKKRALLYAEMRREGSRAKKRADKERAEKRAARRAKG